MARVQFCDAQMDVLKDADALVIVTEWKVFRSPDFSQIRAMLKTPVIIDGRNPLRTRCHGRAGIEYHAIGRSSAR
jgi:UDPglucose 6-dehydrogenase